MPVLTFSPVSLTAFTHQVTVVPAILHQQPGGACTLVTYHRPAGPPVLGDDLSHAGGVAAVDLTDCRPRRLGVGGRGVECSPPPVLVLGFHREQFALQVAIHSGMGQQVGPSGSSTHTYWSSLVLAVIPSRVRLGLSWRHQVCQATSTVSHSLHSPHWVTGHSSASVGA